MGGLDGLVFTAGIGENAPEIRAAGLRAAGLAGRDARRRRERRRAAGRISPAEPRFRSGSSPTDEELMIARHTHDLIAARAA